MDRSDGSRTATHDHLDAPEVAAALAEYQAELDAGRRPDREAFIARHPEIATLLDGCLRAIEFVQAMRPAPPSPPLGPGSVVGDFRIVREVGRGGMGVVFEAVQVSLGRRVALKVLPSAGGLDDRALRRFRHEAQAVATLQHPHIVPVYAVGEAGGVHFLAMQFIDGRSLAEVVTVLRGRGTGETSASPASTADHISAREASAGATALPASLTPVPGTPDYFRAVARLVAQVAEALQHAHELGVVHRDIKPGNLLLDGSGDVWVADFGLAKLPGSDLTGTADVMGTIRYMSPEQASGRAVALDGRTDVYSLGVTLYELLTLEPAFAADDRRALLRKVMEDELVPPRKRVASLPNDLAVICLKAAAKEPARRYQSAGEFAADLRRFLDGRPVTARPVGPAERVFRWARRKPTAAAAILLGVVAVAGTLVAVTVAGLWRTAETARNALAGEKLQTESARDAAVQARRAAESARDDAVQARANESRLREELARVTHARTVDLALREWQAANVGRAAELLAHCRPDLRGWEWHHVDRLCRGDLVTLVGHTGTVWTAEYSPDGTRILTAGEDGTAKVWDAETGVCVRTFRGHVGPVHCAAFHPTAARAVTAGQDGTARVWDLATGECAHTLRAHAGGVTSVAFAPSGKLLATAGRDLAARLWDPDTGREMSVLNGHKAMLNSVAFSPDGTRLVTASGDHSARVWDVTTGTELQCVRGVATTIMYSARFSPDGHRLVTTGGAGVLRVWTAATGAEQDRLLGHTGFVFSAAFSPDGKAIASAGEDRVVRVWEALSKKVLATFRGHAAMVRSVAFRPDGRRLVTAGRDGTAKVWDLTAATDTRVLRGFTGLVASASISPDGARCVTLTSPDHLARVWELDTGRTLGALAVRAELSAPPVFDPTGRRIATGAADGRVWVCDAETHREVCTLPGHTSGVNSVAFDRDGARLVTAGRDGTARVWDVASGTAVRTLGGHDGSVNWAAFDATGRRVGTAGQDGTARVWDLGTGECVHTIRGHNGPVLGVAFDAGGSLLVTAGRDGTARVWSADTAQPGAVLAGHTSFVTGVLFTPEGRVVSTGSDGTTRVWDAVAGHNLLTLTGGTNRTPVVTASRDGGRLLVNRDEGVMVWDGHPVSRGVGGKRY